jgi:hypothetical protein
MMKLDQYREIFLKIVRLRENKKATLADIEADFKIAFENYMKDRQIASTYSFMDYLIKRGYR